MTRKHGLLNLLIIVGLLFFLGGSFGCASYRKIRATDTLLTENSMQKIAVVGVSKINWPRMGKGGSVLGVADSKEALTVHLANTSTVLSNKGYQVVSADPVGVGYSCNNWWLMPEGYGEKEKADVQLEKINGTKPAFVYEPFQNDQAYSQAVHRIIGQVESAITTKTLNTFTPSAEDLLTVREATGADTLCLDRVFGIKYSTGRKTGRFVVGALLGVYTNTSDMMEDFYIFIEILAPSRATF